MTASDVPQSNVRPATDGVLDLRPPKESLRAELCRLGFEYSSADQTGESWRDYQRGVLATFDGDVRHVDSRTVAEGHSHRHDDRRRLTPAFHLFFQPLQSNRIVGVSH